MANEGIVLRAEGRRELSDPLLVWTGQLVPSLGRPDVAVLDAQILSQEGNCRTLGSRRQWVFYPCPPLSRGLVGERPLPGGQLEPCRRLCPPHRKPLAK